MRRLSDIENSNYSCDVQEAIQKLDKEHTNGPVPECFSQQARQFKVLAIDDIVVKLNERDSCVKIDNQLILVQNFVEDEGGVNEYKQVEHFFKYPIDSNELGIYVVSNLSTNVRCFMIGKKLQKRYSIPDAPKIARQHKLDPGKPSCPKLCHSTPDLPNDEMKRIKGTKSRKRRHALPNAPVITREQISSVVDNLHLSGQSSPELHSHGQSSPDVSPHGQCSPHLCPHSQMSHNLRPSCYYSPDLYADGHSTPEIHSSPQTSTTILSSGWHVRSESCTSVLLRNILTKQEMLMEQLRIIFKTLQCMQSSQETEIGLDRNLLPLKDLSSLQNMEDSLRSTPDLHKKLVNTLALKVNMRGVNGKTGFLRLQIRDVVIVAVRRNRLTSEATEKEIDSTVKRWLYLAPDRDGGRKERMKNKLVIHLMSDEDTDREGEGSKSKKKRVYAPQKFLTKYQDQWPCLRHSKVPNHAFCTVCNYDFDVSHQGATGNRPSITREMQLPNEELSIGHDTNTFIQSQGNLELRSFYRDVRKIFFSAADYMISKFPFGDVLLMHAVVADIEKRQSVKFLSLKFFISCFPSILPEKVTVDQVEDEFKIYQTTSFEDSILRKHNDEAWRDIGQLKRPISKSSPTFQQSCLEYW
ncbi:uncharacterized protein LOC113085053 isoform X1 [Tachysurus ichikawai]